MSSNEPKWISMRLNEQDPPLSDGADASHATPSP